MSSLLVRHAKTAYCLHNRFINECLKTVLRTVSLQFPTERYSVITKSSRFLERNPVNLTSVRFKKKTRKQIIEEDEDEEDEEENDEDDEVTGKGIEIKKCTVDTLRVDHLLKVALNKSRRQIDAAFYEGKIRINGRKPVKKSSNININYEIDLIKGFHPQNDKLLTVSRIEVLNIKPNDTKDALEVKLRKYKSTTVENYEADPYKKIEMTISLEE